MINFVDGGIKRIPNGIDLDITITEALDTWAKWQKIADQLNTEIGENAEVFKDNSREAQAEKYIEDLLNEGVNYEL